MGCTSRADSSSVFHVYSQFYIYLLSVQLSSQSSHISLFCKRERAREEEGRYGICSSIDHDCNLNASGRHQ